MPRLVQSLRCGLAAVAIAAWAGLAFAAPESVISGFGATHTAPKAAEHPDKSLRYRVVFSITKGADEGKANEDLAKVARFVNLLGDDGIRAKAGDIVAVVHGDATRL